MLLLLTRRRMDTALSRRSTKKTQHWGGGLVRKELSTRNIAKASHHKSLLIRSRDLRMLGLRGGWESEILKDKRLTYFD